MAEIVGEFDGILENVGLGVSFAKNPRAGWRDVGANGGIAVNVGLGLSLGIPLGKELCVGMLDTLGLTFGGAGEEDAPVVILGFGLMLGAVIAI